MKFTGFNLSYSCILFLCVIGLNCRSILIRNNFNPALEYVALEIIREENLINDVLFYISDSTSYENMSWSGEVPSDIDQVIQIGVFNELISNLDNANNTKNKINISKNKAQQGLYPILTLSNFGLNSTREYLIIYVERIYGELSGNGELRIYKLTNSELSFPAIYVIKLWES